MSFRHVFSFHFLLTGSNVCTFLIPSKQVVSVLKHKLVCTIMKSSAGASLLLPQSTSPPAWLVPAVIPLREPAAGGMIGDGAGFVVNQHLLAFMVTFWGSISSY